MIYFVGGKRAGIVTSQIQSSLAGRRVKVRSPISEIWQPVR